MKIMNIMKSFLIGFFCICQSINYVARIIMMI